MLNQLRRRLMQVRNVGPGPAVRIIAWRTGRLAGNAVADALALVRPTGLGSVDLECAPRRIVPAMAPPIRLDPAPFAAGRFDLLASGPCGLARTFDEKDLPAPWRARARAVTALMPGDVAAIDWHLDPRSGHRWRASRRSNLMPYGEDPGIEVKWPWEVGRLQHLPAIAASIGDPSSHDGILKGAVVRAHVLDFIRSNPPGFGVQWLCPMDIGIRVANMLLAVDLARAAGVSFDDPFLRTVSASARDHARHVAGHLEWGAGLCSNHYLANVAGLLYAGAYLGDDAEARDWLAFAGREMLLQVGTQFDGQGSNFEGSTCYHRLSAEMAVHSVALMLWVSRHRPEDARRWWDGPVRNFHPSPAAPPAVRTAGVGFEHPFDEGLARRVWGMGSFVESIARADGSIPQVGDNDSGRFLRLGMGDDPAADILDHRHLPAAVRAVFGRSRGSDGAEASWIARWLGGARLEVPAGAPEVEDRWDDFGLFVLRAGRITATLRCGGFGQRGNGGHAHCDQLSVTLSVDGVAFIDDPGTGVYTPDPELRNALRSSIAHSTVVVPGAEQGHWLSGRWGLFAMSDRSQPRRVEAAAGSVVAEMTMAGRRVRREASVDAGGLTIRDVAPEGSFANLVLHPGVKIVSAGVDGAVLRRSGIEVRVAGAGCSVHDSPWSGRYGEVGRTVALRLAPGVISVSVQGG